MIRIGVISDDHVNVQHHKGDPNPVETLRQMLLKPFADVDAVIHAGDSTSFQVFSMLVEEFGLVYAVSGNMDTEALAKSLCKTLILNFEDVIIGVVHGNRDDGEITTEYLRATFADSHADCVVFGHTHTPYNKREDSVLMFNPGATTTEHFRQTDRPTVGILTIEEKSIRGEIIVLQT